MHSFEQASLENPPPSSAISVAFVIFQCLLSLFLLPIQIEFAALRARCPPVDNYPCNETDACPNETEKKAFHAFYLP
jgi:hypothetical protein